MHTFEAVACSWGSGNAPAVSRVMGGASERNKNIKTKGWGGYPSVSLSVVLHHVFLISGLSSQVLDVDVFFLQTKVFFNGIEFILTTNIEVSTQLMCSVNTVIVIYMTIYMLMKWGIREVKRNLYIYMYSLSKSH